MAITTLDGLIAALTGTPQSFPYLKNFTPQTAASYVGTWVGTGIPGVGATPSSGLNGDIPTKATVGAIPFTNPGAGNTLYFGRLNLLATQGGSFTLYDRLWQNTFSATSTSLQTITQPAVTRGDLTGKGVELWMQVYSVMGAANPTFTVKYTDQDGNTNQSATGSMGLNSASTGRAGIISLAAGDTGVRVVESVQLNTSNLSGTIGLALRRALLSGVIPLAGMMVTIDPIIGGLPKVEPDACLEFAWFSSNTTAMLIAGNLTLIEG